MRSISGFGSIFHEDLRDAGCKGIPACKLDSLILDLRWFLSLLGSSVRMSVSLSPSSTVLVTLAVEDVLMLSSGCSTIFIALEASAAKSTDRSVVASVFSGGTTIVILLWLEK